MTPCMGIGSDTISPGWVGAPTRRICIHCSSPVSERRISSFCCSGCETVFALLQARGLGEYYRIRDRDRGLRKVAPVELSPDSYTQLDDPKFVELYARRSGELLTLKLYLEGVHCAACVWLSEKIGDFVPSVQSARLNLGDSVVEVTIQPSGSFAAVAREYARLGYRPHPVRTEDLDALARRSDRMLLARTGVAGACAGNIMLLAVSLYAGADGPMAEVFRWVSFALSLPVLCFSATPFYRGAWIALRGRQISIDIPIALGIFLGALSSAYNLVAGSPYLYFDSLSSLVFLMLASRYLLRKTQQAATHASRLIHFLTPARVRVIDSQSGSFREIAVDEIHPGDEVEVRAGECIAVDGFVVSGRSSLDNALLTGESKPVTASEGMIVFAGTVNQMGPLRIRATAAGGATRLGRTLRAVQEDLSKKAPIVTFADRIARYFVAAVLVAVAIVFGVGLRSGLDHAVNLALALSIVTCPCAFALATPLALSISMGRCARQGVLIKGVDVIERLSQARSVLFDKTGTLTRGKYEVTGWDPALGLDKDLKLASELAALESCSQHPVAKAIVQRFEPPASERLPTVQEFSEELGWGVLGQVQGHRYEISSRGAQGPLHAASSAVAVWRDGVRLGRIYFGDCLREDSSDVMARLRDLGLSVGIISGDSADAVARVAANLGLSPQEWRAELSPEDKREEAARTPRTVMVGDGANDAGALAAAHVGIAVQGGMEVSLLSADIYVRSPGVGAVGPLVVIARETLKVIRRNFVFSLVYNALGIAGVVAGLVTPLFAAILMPISALTVFLSSLAGTARLRRALGEITR